jgi:hypothetical protein
MVSLCVERESWKTMICYYATALIPASLLSTVTVDLSTVLNDRLTTNYLCDIFV